MKIGGAVTSWMTSRCVKITKHPQFYITRPREELLLIQVSAQLDSRKRPAEGADKNTNHHAEID